MNTQEADQTIPEDGDGAPPSERVATELGLVVACCPEQPWRVGEVAVVPGGGGRGFVFGRGEGDATDRRQRLRFVRRARGVIEAVPGISLGRISREQALMHVDEGGQLVVRNVGRCALVHDGTEVSTLRVGPGDVLQFGQQLLLVCVETAPHAPAAAGEPAPTFEYGRADAHGMVGESAAIWRLRRQVSFLAPREGHVLVLGASGTGKELVARAVHALSSRRASPMVCRNAATIPDTLVDAELFGNMKNYPNAGMPERPGLVGEAHGSTLFLDELAELPVSVQAHLLRLLDGGEYQRLGESRARRSDFRLIGATNRGEHALKEDLLARFPFRIHMPDLADRREDIPFLARHLLRTFEKDGQELPASFRNVHGEPDAPIQSMTRLLRHEYRTNVRELAALLWEELERTRHGHRPPSVRSMTPPPRIAISAAALAVTPPERTTAPPPAPTPDGEDDPEGVGPADVRRVLQESNGRLELAWRALGLKNRYVLRRLIQKWGIEVQRRPVKK